MALRGTLTHRKTRRLAMELGIMPCFALGVLESLWHVTGEQAANGAIGRLSNADIAMEMFYTGDPDALIKALVAVGILDEDAAHRLIVHDWHAHSDDATNARLARAGQRYANGEIPRLGKLSHKERAAVCARFGINHEAGAQRQPAAHNGALPEPVPVPDPEPEPEPVPEPEPKEKQKPSRAKREHQPDRRHEACRLACQTYALQKKVVFQWDGSEAKQLSLLLAASPELTVAKFQRCLENRGRSAVPHGERPREWLGTLLKYLEGPLDKFGKPQGDAHGADRFSEGRGQRRVREAFAELEKTGFRFPEGGDQAGVDEVWTAEGRDDDLGVAGVVLEGAR